MLAWRGGGARAGDNLSINPININEYILENRIAMQSQFQL